MTGKRVIAHDGETVVGAYMLPSEWTGAPGDWRPGEYVDDEDGEAVFVPDEGLTLLAHDEAGIGWAIVNGVPIAPPSPPEPPPTLADYQRAIEAHVDAVARARSYASAVSCASYATSAHPVWGEEARAFVAWRDAVWVEAFDLMADVEGGQQPQPTIAQMIAALPAMQWPEA